MPRIPRFVYVEHPPVLETRLHIFGVIWNGIMLGAGVGSTVFCRMLLGAPGHWRRSRAAARV